MREIVKAACIDDELHQENYTSISINVHKYYIDHATTQQKQCAQPCLFYKGVTTLFVL